MFCVFSLMFLSVYRISIQYDYLVFIFHVHGDSIVRIMETCSRSCSMPPPKTMATPLPPTESPPTATGLRVDWFDSIGSKKLDSLTSLAGSAKMPLRPCRFCSNALILACIKYSGARASQDSLGSLQCFPRMYSFNSSFSGAPYLKTLLAYTRRCRC